MMKTGKPTRKVVLNTAPTDYWVDLRGQSIRKMPKVHLQWVVYPSLRPAHGPEKTPTAPCLGVDSNQHLYSLLDVWRQLGPGFRECNEFRWQGREVTLSVSCAQDTILGTASFDGPAMLLIPADLALLSS